MENWGQMKKSGSDPGTHSNLSTVLVYFQFGFVRIIITI